MEALNREISLPVWQHVSLIFITSISISHLWSAFNTPTHTRVVVREGENGDRSKGKNSSTNTNTNASTKEGKETAVEPEKEKEKNMAKAAKEQQGKGKEPEKTKDITETNAADDDGAAEDENDDLSETEYDSEIEELPEGAIKDYAFPLEAFKMVLCVNTSLKKMDKGKAMAQCGHATLGAYRISDHYAPSNVKHWLRLGQTKIAVKCTEEEMEQVAEHAKRLGVVSYTVEDAGRTQIPAGSKTVCALGPAPQSVLNEITGNFKLM
jgi:PTH2 family peptidyl-tRNA hydrolase